MTARSTKILLLEDDMLLAEILVDELSERGFAVTLCEDAKSALDAGYEQHFDLWIFDVKVPKDRTINTESNTTSKDTASAENGFEVLKILRECGKSTPAIFLTSLAMIDNLREGFGVGCDDYIRKPFDLDELFLRVESLLKRQFSHQSAQKLDLGNGLAFDILQKTLYRDGIMVSLTNKERELLALLLQHRGNFVSQEEIFDRIWGFDEVPTNMSLRVYIKNLRKIVGKHAIATQRHRGYCYV